MNKDKEVLAGEIKGYCATHGWDAPLRATEPMPNAILHVCTKCEAIDRYREEMAEKGKALKAERYAEWLAKTPRKKAAA